MESDMKLFSVHALVSGPYAIVLGLYAWYEHELLVAAVGILPPLLFMVVHALDGWFEGREWRWTTAHQTSALRAKLGGRADLPKSPSDR
jgi:hypothetical protein